MKSLLFLTILLLVVAQVSPAAAGTDFITMNMADTPEGQDPDGQTRFEVSKEMQLIEEGFLWNTGVSIHGNYTLDGVGYMDEDSAPFNLDHSPAVFARRTINKWLTLDSGILHQSDGESGEDSRSWNRNFSRANINWFDDSGNIHVVGSAMAWHVLDVGENSEYLHELRAVGEGNFGFQGDFQAAYKDDFMVFGEFSKNFALTGVGINPTGGNNTYMLVAGALTGKGQNLLEKDASSRQLFAGIALNPAD